MKLSVRTCLIIGALSLGASALSGAAHAAEPAQPPAPSESKPAAKPAAPQGLSELIDRALTSIELKPEQQSALEPLATAIDTADSEVAKASNDLTLALATQLEAGKIDRQSMSSAIDALMAARLRERPVLNKELVAIHDTLDKAERAKFADALEKGIKSYVDEEHQTSALGLTEKQTQDLRSAFGGGSEGADQPLTKMLAAFRSDSFDPDQISPQHDASARAEQHAAKMLEAVESLSHLLTPEQRTSLSKKLRDSVSEEVKDDDSVGSAEDALSEDAASDEDNAAAAGDDEDEALRRGVGGGRVGRHRRIGRGRGGRGGRIGVGGRRGFGRGRGRGWRGRRWGGWGRNWGGWGSWWSGSWSPNVGYAQLDPIVITPVVAVETITPGASFLW